MWQLPLELGGHFEHGGFSLRATMPVASRSSTTETTVYEPPSFPTITSRDTTSHHESSGMELKDLSSNWKKLQLTLKQNNIALNEQLSARGQEKQHGLKRNR